MPSAHSALRGRTPSYSEALGLGLGIIWTATAWFTLEVIIRFISCPSKILFWRDFKNIVDLTAIVPYYVTLFNVLSTMSCAGAKSSASLAFLRVIRLIRVFKLTKHSVGLQVLILTFKASLEGLSLFPEGLRLIMHRTIGLTGYIGPLAPTLVSSSFSPIVRCIIKCN